MDTAELSATTSNVGLLERITSVTVGAVLIGRLAKNRTLASFGGALLGGQLIYRGLSGNCALYRATGINTASRQKTGSNVPAQSPSVERSLTVKGTPEELWDLWSKPETLTAIMAHFAHVEPVGEGITHWQVKGPARKELQWNSRNTVEDRGRELAWESLPGTQLPNQGRVMFKPAINDRGTVVTVWMQFEPPLGPLGSSVAKTFDVLPKSITGASLRRFKALAETGEIPTLANNSSARGTGDYV